MDDILNAYQQFHWIPVIIAAVANFVLGAIWYSPKVFGSMWVKEMGVDEEEMKKSANMVMILGGSFLLTLVSAITLGFIIRGAGHANLSAGIYAGFIVGLGFIFVTLWKHYLFERKSMRFLMINGGHDLLGFVLMGAVIGGFEAMQWSL